MGNGPVADARGRDVDIGHERKQDRAAMADYDPEGEYPSLQTALLDHDIDTDLLAECLDAAEKILAEPEFNRWPSVPARGYG